MLQNAPNCTIKNFFFSGKHSPGPETPVAKSWLCHASQAPPPQIIVGLLVNPAYAHELLLRNMFVNPPWQTVDCVYSTLYVYALQNLFREQK